MSLLFSLYTTSSYSSFATTKINTIDFVPNEFPYITSYNNMFDLCNNVYFKRIFSFIQLKFPERSSLLIVISQLQNEKGVFLVYLKILDMHSLHPKSIENGGQVALISF